MRGSSTINRKNKNADRKIIDSELPARIKGIRSSLELTQAEFALKLGVNRAQVGEWERGGDERPSIEKFLDIAGLAPDREDRIWFWKKAGVNLDLIKADFREELRARTAERDPNKTIDIPVFRHLAHDRNGKLGYTKDGSVSLPSDLIDHPGAAACFASERRRPWITRDGDLVLIDRSITQPKDLWGKPTAVFFSGLPATREVVMRAVPFPLGFSVREQPEYIEPMRDINNQDVLNAWNPTREFMNELDKRWVQMVEEASGPGFLVGWLHVIQAGDDLDVDIDMSDSPPWRLTFTSQSPLSHYCPRIAISDWQYTHMPDIDYLTTSHAPLLSGIEILGHVVGWLSKKTS